MTLKMTKSNEVMEFFTIKTSGISLDELTSILLHKATDDKDLDVMLKLPYSKLMKQAKDHLFYEGLRLTEDDIDEKTNFDDFTKSFNLLKKHLQRNSRNSYLGKTRTQILEEKQINQDVKSYMQGTQ